jgi:hypothetical protein
LNQEPDELVRSIFYNLIRNEIIKVSVSDTDHYSALHCYAVSLDDLQTSREIFEDDEIAYPGFIEFDSFLNRALVLEGSKNNYKMRRLDTLECQFESSSFGISDLKMCQEALMIIRRRSPVELSVTLQGDEDTVTAIVPIHRKDDIEIVEKSDVHLAVKQRSHDLVIYHLVDGSAVQIPETGELSAHQFLFLGEAKRIVIETQGQFRVYTYQGAYLFTIGADHPLDTAPVATSRDQKFLVAVSQTEFDQWIYLFSLEDGALLFEGYIPPNQNNGHAITCVAFDETTYTVMAANALGLITFWG